MPFFAAAFSNAQKGFRSSYDTSASWRFAARVPALMSILLETRFSGGDQTILPMRMASFAVKRTLFVKSWKLTTRLKVGILRYGSNCPWDITRRFFDDKRARSNRK